MAAVLRGVVSLVYENVKATRRFLPVRNSGYMYARLPSGDNMSNRWSKFRLLMWKNWVLAKRHRKQTLMEILAPVMFSILLVIIRGLVHPVDYKDPTVFAPFSPADIKKTLIPYIINATDFGGFVVYSPRSPVLEKIMNSTATKLGLQAIPMPSEGFFLSLLKTNYVFMKLNLAAVFFDESLAGAKNLPKNITVAKSSTNPIRSLLEVTREPGYQSRGSILGWYLEYYSQKENYPNCHQGLVSLKLALRVTTVSLILTITLTSSHRYMERASTERMYY